LVQRVEGATARNEEHHVTASGTIDVIEYTDPICSWAWGTEPKLRLLQWRHGHRLQWRVVMGGLVGDASGGRADWDPVSAAAPMSAYWRRSSAYTGQPYPFPMHRMARSTDPAGVAVKAALEQGEEVAARVLRRFREATFVFGATPETVEHFVAAAASVPGVDVDRWVAAIGSDRAAAAYRADWDETRRPNDFVRNLTGDQVGIGSMKHSEGHDRYAFPTLIFRGPQGERTVAGWMPYEAYVDAMPT
jgi:protein-disulfide isomerase-like protein with CxxC motif